MANAFAISDIHGNYKEFIALLVHWNEEDILIILGDMIDRGPDSLRVVQHIMQLKEEYGDKVVVLLGNHDQLLTDFIQDPDEHGPFWAQCGGNETIHSFLKDDSVFYLSYEERAIKLMAQRKAEILFLKNLPCYYKFGQVLFTHAGFCSWAHFWEETTDKQFVWIRDHYKHKNNSGYINVFGHTPTQLINSNMSNEVWVNEDGTYIGIDGACAYGGQLNAVLLNQEGELLSTYSVK